MTSLIQWAILVCQATPQATPAQECVRWMYDCQIYELQMSDGRSLEFIQEQCSEELPPELIYDSKGK
jgi:hypothetical protein